jgi:methylenetetrahydrofolate reductase (NADPH)
MIDGMTRPEACCVQVTVADGVLEPRYEILPFGKAEQQAGEVAGPLRLTVTSSPRHGVDHSLEHAVRLRDLGHAVTLHLAARMVRGPEHLEELLERAHGAGIDDLFVIGGDSSHPLGPYDAAGPVLELVAAHPLRPPRLGIAAYPEGHPLITPAELEASLEAKARLADYLVTQLCFDPNALLGWLDGVRARAIELPLYVGAVGAIDRRRLVEISARIGVGPSLRFLRKQHGATKLFGNTANAADAFHDAIVHHAGDPRLCIAGFHFFTFNNLLGTIRWVDAHR